MSYRPYIEQVALGAISSWEATAILTRGRVPTVTSQVMRLPRPARAVLVGLVAWWMVAHFQVRWVFGRFTSTQSNYGGDPLPHTTRNDPIVGYRTWRVLQTDEGPYALHSLHIEYWWNVENTASCHATAMAMFPRPELHDGASPDLTCNCGLYAQLPDHSLGEWNHMVSGRVRASGTIALSGTIIRCERGYKGQYATIQSPVVLEVDCCRFHGFCENPVTQVALPDGRIRDAYGHCDDHPQPRDEDAVMVPAEAFMRNVQEQLTSRYESVEFLTWYDI